MAVRTPKAKPQVRLPGIEVAQLTNFSGGPNFRDSPTELAATEAYSAYNCTFDERGGVQSRLGYAKRNLTPIAAAVPVNDYFSPLLNVQLTQVGTGLYKGDSTSSVHTFTTADCVTFAELGGKVIVGHPVDGLWSSPDGTTWTHITSANAPTTANCIATWMSKLFVGMADGTLRWSAASDPTTWSATDFNAIWTKDQKPLVALHVGSGQDIQGRPGLLVFKQDSVYRVNDSGTGAYTVLDTAHGAGGPKAVIGVGARVCWIGRGGIWWWREDQAGPFNASDLLRPLWDSMELSFAHQIGWAAGRRLNRAYFSVSTINSSTNDLSFEFHPDEEWIVPRSDAMACYSVDSSGVTYGGSPTVNGQMYKLDTGGTDDGASITGWFQSRWLVPNGGFEAQVWQVRLHGRGSGTMTYRTDYQDAGGKGYLFNLASTGATWGIFTWGAFTWAGSTLAETQQFAGLGSCRQFSLRFDFTVNTTSTGRTLFGSVPAPSVGAFALYGAEISFIPLGLS